jgi:hypothetical protein
MGCCAGQPARRRALAPRYCEFLSTRRPPRLEWCERRAMTDVSHHSARCSRSSGPRASTGLHTAPPRGHAEPAIRGRRRRPRHVTYVPAAGPARPCLRAVIGRFCMTRWTRASGPCIARHEVPGLPRRDALSAPRCRTRHFPVARRWIVEFCSYSCLGGAGWGGTLTGGPRPLKVGGVCDEGSARDRGAGAGGAAVMPHHHFRCRECPPAARRRARQRVGGHYARARLQGSELALPARGALPGETAPSVGRAATETGALCGQAGAVLTSVWRALSGRNRCRQEIFCRAGRPRAVSGYAPGAMTWPGSGRRSAPAAL